MNSAREDAALIGRRAFCASLAALPLSPLRAREDARSPDDLIIGGQYAGIIDIYQDNDPFDFDLAWRLGVRAVIHGVIYTHRGCQVDGKYEARKDKALSMGFLWGAYCMMTSENVDAQLQRLFSVENGANENTLIALDWEQNRCGAATHDQIRQAVGKFREKTGFYPMLYGSPFFSSREIQDGDPLLAECPLWYANYSGADAPRSPPPTRTWKNYTLWQFDDEHRKNGAPYPAKVLPGADWSKFKGRFDALRKAWPFRQS